ncbi:MAG TPA: ribonuclease Y, partial [Calditrichia bacterium]|nr:ribonuclease Y [Calditrichia bacterium]
FEKRRQQITGTELALDQREMEVDRRSETVNQKAQELERLELELREKDSFIQEKTGELNDLIRQELVKLEEISGLNREDAKALLLKDFEEEAQDEGARLASAIIEDARLEARRKSRNIVVQAIQQIASEQSVEATISIIHLPNDDMKGRIIGREGRNIRAFEMTTGVDVIIDDTPEIVVLSSYNSFRREIAKTCLEKLITDGRIHPARIEEVFEKTSEEMRESLREIGEEALLDVGVHGVNSELTELIGKLRYRTAYGQNVLSHTLEVAQLCGIMAAELGLEVKSAKRAAMFHDIGKALDNYTEANHAQLGAELLKKNGEAERIVKAVASHHEDEELSDPIAVLVYAANQISGNRPGARRESLETFIKRMEELEHIAEGFDGVDKAFAIQSGREVRVMVGTLDVDDSHARNFAREIAKKIQDEMEIPGQVKVTVIREYRAFDVAT